MLFGKGYFSSHPIDQSGPIKEQTSRKNYRILKGNEFLISKEGRGLIKQGL